MPAIPDDAPAGFETYLHDEEQIGLLRFLTCGSVGDGKSTLLGRLLSESKIVFDDHLSAAEGECSEFRTQGDRIDVAYRYFATDKRRFIAADTPGHEQYTPNMATGASTADLAVILVDARKGVITQTRRHSYIVSMLGIRHVVLAVNKMDLVDYDRQAFDDIATDYKAFAAKIDLPEVHCVPLSALEGENVCNASGAMPWYDGLTLMTLLETVEVDDADIERPMRLPVQWVNRPNSDFRGFSGTIATGRVARGDQIVVSPSGQTSRVARIVGPSGDLDQAVANQAVTLVLEDEIDVSRGDMIAPVDAPPGCADRFAAHIVWMHDEPMLPERPYLIRFATASATAQITDLSYRIDVNSLEKLATKTLDLNEVGYCKLATDREIAFDAYADNRQTGAFVLIDKLTNATVGAGVIDFALRRSANISWHDMKVDKSVRAEQNGQKPCVLWFTGLSGAGKSTVADRLEQKLHAIGRRTYLLDGDNVRHGLNKDLGFTDQDRVENVRRVSEVAQLMVDAGLIVLASFISPFRSERSMARELVAENEFVEIFVDAPLEVCESRDPKGLYKKARAGEIKNFTGIDSLYEAPLTPEVTLKSGDFSAEDLADQIIGYLEETGRI